MFELDKCIRCSPNHLAYRIIILDEIFQEKELKFDEVKINK